MKNFVRNWGPVVLMGLISLVSFNAYQILQKLDEDARLTLAAKARLEGERETIRQTRETVTAIERRLQTNDVPDRLERIESTVTTAVEDNSQAIDKITEALHMILGIPKEVIRGDREMVEPEDLHVPEATKEKLKPDPSRPVDPPKPPAENSP
jgi:hypothetical protein